MNNIHIIDQEGIFIDNLDNIFKSFSIYGETGNTTNYNIVSILGPQSSGKSTLINSIFDTSFEIMDSSRGRYQCTKGIWLSETNKNNLLIFDVEGTDSRERYDNNSFEKKVALFTFALSNIFIVNLWYHDLGRYNATNINLLNIVLELNLQLFEDNNKKLILFIVRDCRQEDNMYVHLKKMINDDMDKIWLNIDKPDKYKNSLMHDFFDFKYIALPHKFFESEKFIEKVEELSNIFNMGCCSFADAEHTLPIDSFPLYAKKIWNTILNNKDLDLPSQKEMVTKYRCDELINELYLEFKTMFNKITLINKNTIIENYGHKCDIIIDDIINKYNNCTIKYDVEIVSEYRTKLLDKIIIEVKKIWLYEIKKINNIIIESYQSNLNNLTRVEKLSDVKSQWNDISFCFNDHINKFICHVNVTSIKRAKFKHNDIIRDIMVALENIKNFERDRLINRILELIRDKFSKADFKKDMHDGKNNMWDIIRNKYNNAIRLPKLEELLKYIELDDDNISYYVTKNKEYEVDFIQEMCINHISQLDYQLERKFISLFKFKKDGLPRVWTTNTHDMDSIFKESRDNTIKLIDLLAIFRFDEKYDDLTISSDTYSNIPKNIILIPKMQVDMMIKMFDKYAQSVYEQAKFEQENNNISGNIPNIVWASMALLGMNEAIWLVSNPLLLILCSMLFSIFYVVSQINGGIIQMSELYFQKGIDTVKYIYT
jgi:hypothetical protein